jgi:hypothetical protein
MGNRRSDRLALHLFGLLRTQLAQAAKDDLCGYFSEWPNGTVRIELEALDLKELAGAVLQGVP